jgi:tight adherence protein B
MPGALLALAAALVAWPGEGAPLRRLTGRAGLPPGLVPPAAALTSPAVAGPAGLVVGAVLSTPLVAVLCGGCAALGARAVGARQRAAAADVRVLALADGIAVLSAELRAGRSTMAAVAAAAEACPDEGTGRELSTALTAAAAGASGTAGGEVSPDLTRIRAAVELSVATGCSLVAVLTALEDDLRARHRQRLELRSATAGPRASAIVLAGLPVLGLAMGSGVGADPWRVLTTTGPGQVLLVAGVLLEVAGVAWVGRLTRRAAPELFPVGRPRGH